MGDLLSVHKIPNLNDALNTELAFKIPVIDSRWVEKYPDVLCHASAEHYNSVDTWLNRGWGFASETSVTSLDQCWISIINSCLRGTALYLNQHDPSSAIRVRPDTTILRHNALLVKGEAKLSEAEMETAKNQLLKSFFSGAVRCFPRSSQTAILGVTTCSTKASMYKISYNNGRFSAILHRDYNLQVVHTDRLLFIVDIFKAMRWMTTVDSPISKFHLVPSVRRRTRNGHHVTWCNRGILKEYHNPREHLIDRIVTVYGHKLSHVEWGEAVPDDANAIIITRVGSQLEDALAAGDINRDDAVAHIRLAVEELHNIGFAHCDIVMDNVFVDNDGVAFLDDLEYLTPVNDPAPANARWNSDAHPGLSATELDTLLMKSFVLEVMRA